MKMEKKLKSTVAKGEPLKLTGFYKAEHDIPGLATKGDTVSDQQLRDHPNFANPDDEIKDFTFTANRKRLLDTGALKPVTEDEAKVLRSGAEASSGESTPSGDGLDEMTKADLLKVAEEDGVEVHSSQTKQEILDAIRAKRSGTSSDEGDEGSGGEDE